VPPFQLVAFSLRYCSLPADIPVSLSFFKLITASLLRTSLLADSCQSVPAFLPDDRACLQMIAINLDRASVTDDLWLFSKQACVLADVCIFRAFECIAIFDFIPCIYFQLVTPIAIAAEVLFKGVLLGLYSHFTPYP
jgi:hypothetical protein